MSNLLSRRKALIAGLGTALALPSLTLPGRARAAEPPAPAAPAVRHNISSFAMQDWRDHFDHLGKGAIVADTESRALHYWNHDASIYKIYPTSVPISDALTKRGYTSIVRKRENPTWTPTASQLKRFPDWKPIGPGPDNPLGPRAMYLSWPAYLIHGTQDTRKIGRRSSDGCIGLYNDKIRELYGMCEIGTQVRVI